VKRIKSIADDVARSDAGRFMMIEQSSISDHDRDDIPIGNRWCD